MRAPLRYLDWEVGGAEHALLRAWLAGQGRYPGLKAGARKPGRLLPSGQHGRPVSLKAGYSGEACAGPSRTAFTSLKASEQAHRRCAGPSPLWPQGKRGRLPGHAAWVKTGRPRGGLNNPPRASAAHGRLAARFARAIGEDRRQAAWPPSSAACDLEQVFMKALATGAAAGLGLALLLASAGRLRCWPVHAA